MNQQKECLHTNSNPLKDYLAELLGLYRSIGLFKQYDSVSLEELTERLKNYILEEFGFRLEKLFDKTKLRRIIDVLILSYDTERVWIGDTKEEVNAETKLYKETLLNWSRISEGKFQPRNIREIWDEDKELIYLDMVVKDEYEQIQIDILPDILDVGSLAKQVNELLAEQQNKFYIIGLEDIALVVMLTEEEQQRLSSERGIEFVAYEELEGFPPAKLGLYLKNFKSIFNKWRLFEFILFIIAAIDFAYLSYRGLKFLSTRITSRIDTSQYFLPADSYYWLFICIFIGIVLGGYSSRALLRIILKDKDEGYKIYLQMFCGEGELSSRIVKYLSILISTAAAVFIFLGMNWYALFTDNEVVINPLWSLNKTHYEYSEVQSVKKVERLEEKGRKTFVRRYIEINFKDGSSWASNSEGRTPSPYFDEELAEFVAEKSGKTVEISH
jgi:hypothetical protein